MATSRPSQPLQPLSVDLDALSYITGLVDAFQAFDSDNDGLITAAELRGLLSSHGYEKTEGEAKAMLERADEDRDGLLSVAEFLDVMNAGELGLAALGHLLQSAVPSLAATVRPDGTMASEELARALSVAASASLEDCMDVIACMDGDGDGAVSLEEFKLMAELL